jgi:hypothetical protein
VTDVLLTLNGLVQAALAVAWGLVWWRIRAYADTGEVCFPASDYRIAPSAPPAACVTRRARVRVRRVADADARAPALHNRNEGAWMTAEAYDLLDWQHGAAFGVVGVALGLAASASLGSDVPLLLHTVIAALQLVRHPLTRTYLLGHAVPTRPWPSFNPLL